FAAWRVPDTPEGRFEILVLALFLFLERLKVTRPDGSALARDVIEAFVIDMDDCMREMGVGDLTVPKKVKRAAAAFYERSGAYRDALASADAGALTDAIVRHVYGGDTAPEARRGAEHVSAAAATAWRSLMAASDERVRSGAVQIEAMSAGAAAHDVSASRTAVL
ncbi:MAG: ubiquinol-cytochrome C chaperone family protein, partial [Hyphomicrobium sp.]